MNAAGTAQVVGVVNLDETWLLEIISIDNAAIFLLVLTVQECIDFANKLFQVSYGEGLLWWRGAGQTGVPALRISQNALPKRIEVVPLQYAVKESLEFLLEGTFGWRSLGRHSLLSELKISIKRLVALDHRQRQRAIPVRPAAVVHANVFVTQSLEL